MSENVGKRVFCLRPCGKVNLSECKARLPAERDKNLLYTQFVRGKLLLITIRPGTMGKTFSEENKRKTSRIIAELFIGKFRGKKSQMTDPRRATPRGPRLIDGHYPLFRDVLLIFYTPKPARIH